MKHLKLLAIMLIFAFVGCVSAGEHKSKLDEIETQKKAMASLQEQVKAKDEETIALKKQADSDKSQIDLLSDEKAKIAEEKKKAIEEKEKALSELKSTYNSMMTELQGEIKKGEIAVTQLKDRLSLSMVDRILFDSGSADVKKDGKKVLDRVAEILKKVTDKQIRIEGHTDNVPVGPKVSKKFASNWELSAARAINVVKYLQEQGVDPKLTSATGYGEFKPVASNDTDQDKAKNRRIEIVLTPLETDVAEEKK
jgi:chemotaxis protein MotB